MASDQSAVSPPPLAMVGRLGCRPFGLSPGELGSGVPLVELKGAFGTRRRILLLVTHPGNPLIRLPRVWVIPAVLSLPIAIWHPPLLKHPKPIPRRTKPSKSRNKKRIPRVSK